MSDDSLVILVVGIGIAAWLFWPRGKAKVPRVTPEAPRRPTKPKREMTPDELEVERARRAFEQNDRDRDVARHEHTQENAAARERVERARKYAIDSGLDKVVPALWQKVEHWGSWVGMPDRWQPPEGVTDIGGGGGRDDRFATWSWGGRHYRIGLRRRPNYMPDGDAEFGYIDVAVDGEAVLTLACTRSGYESWEEWRMAAVDMLKVGSWMADLVRCAGHIRLVADRQTWRTFAKTDQERASRIDLGDGAA
ncbi:hypothetical protein [Sphingomonas adhaesiva]|uniref:hypothetical protein n=1 Tax=Sphingomonas adhaesiva TaxID=28212 RepID=UPI002FF7D8B2